MPRVGIKVMQFWSPKGVYARQFTDPRDMNTYNIVMLRDGNWWLGENLRYEMPGSFPADKNPAFSNKRGYLGIDLSCRYRPKVGGPTK